MTKRELERIGRLWQSRLGLDTWDIQFLFEIPDQEDGSPGARCWRSNDYDEARVYFNHTLWPAWSEGAAHRFAVHELLHLVTRDVEVVLDLLSGQLNRDVEQVAHRAHLHNVEQMVDRLMHRFVELAGVED